MGPWATLSALLKPTLAVKGVADKESFRATQLLLARPAQDGVTFLLFSKFKLTDLSLMGGEGEGQGAMTR